MDATSIFDRTDLKVGIDPVRGSETQGPQPPKAKICWICKRPLVRAEAEGGKQDT